MRYLGYLLIISIVALTGTEVRGQSIDQKVDAIRKLYREVTQQVEESEKHGEESSIFLNELRNNKNRGSWPAVGIYESTVKFYYTFGDREKNPYPERLLKILVTTRRSSQTSYLEFLFNPVGQLVFCFQKDDDQSATEHRYYFSNERLIRSTVGPNNALARGDAQTVKDLLTQKRKLTSIFLNSLEN